MDGSSVVCGSVLFPAPSPFWGVEDWAGVVDISSVVDGPVLLPAPFPLLGMGDCTRVVDFSLVEGPVFCAPFPLLGVRGDCAGAVGTGPLTVQVKEKSQSLRGQMLRGFLWSCPAE